MEPIEKLSASEARERLSEIVNEVAFRGRRVIVHRHGKDLVAVVSAEDLALLEALEDRMDLEEARRALKEQAENVSWEDLRNELGL